MLLSQWEKAILTSASFVIFIIILCDKSERQSQTEATENFDE
jgi:hypothetical protein